MNQDRIENGGRKWNNLDGIPVSFPLSHVMGLEIFLLSDVDGLIITDRLVVVVVVVGGGVVVVVEGGLVVVFFGKMSSETPLINLLRLKGLFPFFFFATP